MGQVDLDFKPSVPVFDANVALGRRHDQRVKVDTAEGVLNAMDGAGIDRALVYAPHGAVYDPLEGNQDLLEAVQDERRMLPQLACNPAFDDLDAFATQVARVGARSVRMFPITHNYPFRDWVVKPWLDWLGAVRVPLWLPADYEVIWGADPFDPTAVFETVKSHPNVSVVLCEVRYNQASWAVPLLKSLPNLHIEVSRFVLGNGIPMLVEAIGVERILFGSRFPSSPMALQLYNLHHCGLSEASLAAICSGNLDRLLGSA